MNSAQCPVLEFGLKTGKVIITMQYKLHKFVGVFCFINFIPSENMNHLLYTEVCVFLHSSNKTRLLLM